MNRRKAIILGVLGAFIIIQFFRPDRNQTGQVSDQSMMRLYHPPDSITHIIKQSCMNCHSNNTEYPWYADVQPSGWWLDYHIRKGKEEVNLDEFAGYSDRRKLSKLRSMKSQVRDGDMPLRSYTWMHKDARLSDAQKTQLISWLDKTIDSLNQQ
ncbi:hypothetical protein GCM10027566_24930 [Arachidicoccus ginsenosidivorans]|jgi:hypothetical protein|uniref:Cytochrome C n=1 Tax=Arachidicoccus ginsenosidivorans TaxID=496057 RepID=A0A5B8VPC9_9BACT|nr:heme-binding domain-containing protein [Arachidicoccus ginsenosidivorans]QEC73289.1 cytochrome C [Arachidicoccus ginsenosidivorans]